jgi:hypothetical protein
MLIPVFFSCPGMLKTLAQLLGIPDPADPVRPGQEKSREIILEELNIFGLEPRAVGRLDYPIDFPLREVHTLARRCAGRVILGFEYFHDDGGTWKPNTAEAKRADKPVPFPTPWNQVEAGILFSVGLPLPVFREGEISGGDLR